MVYDWPFGNFALCLCVMDIIFKSSILELGIFIRKRICIERFWLRLLWLLNVLVYCVNSVYLYFKYNFIFWCRWDLQLRSDFNFFLNGQLFIMCFFLRKVHLKSSKWTFLTSSPGGRPLFCVFVSLELKYCHLIKLFIDLHYICLLNFLINKMRKFWK